MANDLERVYEVKWLDTNDGTTHRIEIYSEDLLHTFEHIEDTQRTIIDKEGREVHSVFIRDYTDGGIVARFVEGDRVSPISNSIIPTESVVFQVMEPVGLLIACVFFLFIFFGLIGTLRNRNE